jgi:hypothetical protein
VVDCVGLGAEGLTPNSRTSYRTQMPLGFYRFKDFEVLKTGCHEEFLGFLNPGLCTFFARLPTGCDEITFGAVRPLTR